MLRGGKYSERLIARFPQFSAKLLLPKLKIFHQHSLDTQNIS